MLYDATRTERLKQGKRSETKASKKARERSNGDAKSVRIVGGVPKPGRLTGEKARIWGDDGDVQRLRVRLYG